VMHVRPRLARQPGVGGTDRTVGRDRQMCTLVLLAPHADIIWHASGADKHVMQRMG
jgi:hypothetical protein